MLISSSVPTPRLCARAAVRRTSSRSSDHRGRGLHPHQVGHHEADARLERALDGHALRRGIEADGEGGQDDRPSSAPSGDGRLLERWVLPQDGHAFDGTPARREHGLKRRLRETVLFVVAHVTKRWQGGRSGGRSSGAT